MTVGDRTTVGDRVAAGSDARITDRGYQHYDGERRGPAWAVRAIAIGTFQRSLGFRRPTSAKILPLLLALGCFAPALIVLGVRLLVGGAAFKGAPRAIDNIVPLNTYFTLIATLVLVLTALAASEALCPDRRQRVLPLYYASPVSPRTYLFARVLGVAAVLGCVTILPPLLLWLGNVLLADDPWVYLQGHAGQFAAILASGSVLAFFDGAIGLAVAGFTERKTYAAGALLGGAIALTTVSQTIIGTIHDGWAKYAALVAPLRLPAETANWFFTRTPEPNLPGVLYLIASLVVIVGGFVVLDRAYKAVRF